MPHGCVCPSQCDVDWEKYDLDVYESGTTNLNMDALRIVSAYASIYFVSAHTLLQAIGKHMSGLHPATYVVERGETKYPFARFVLVVDTKKLEASPALESAKRSVTDRLHGSIRKSIARRIEQSSRGVVADNPHAHLKDQLTHGQFEATYLQIDNNNSRRKCSRQFIS